MDNKMDNEMDFRVGDVVCDIRFGTGKIEEIEIDSEWPVRVNFGGNGSEMYLADGRESYIDKLRSLYHGTWEQVFGNLPDLKPKRKVKRWANLYVGDRILYCKKFISPEEALNNSDKTCVAVAVEIEVDE